MKELVYVFILLIALIMSRLNAPGVAYSILLSELGFSDSIALLSNQILNIFGYFVPFLILVRIVLFFTNRGLIPKYFSGLTMYVAYFSLGSGVLLVGGFFLVAIFGAGPGVSGVALAGVLLIAFPLLIVIVGYCEGRELFDFIKKKMA